MSMKERVKKILNYKYVKKGKETLQKKAIKAMVAFLVLMIGCTFLSRAADSMTIPRVQTEKPKSKTMVDELKATAVVEKNREEKIAVLEGLKVDYVNVSEGSVIKIGDTLVELDMEVLNKMADEIKEKITEDQKTLTRATEDYNRAIGLKNQAVNEASNAMNNAKKAYDNYLALSDEEREPEVEDSLYADYQDKKSVYDQAVKEANDNVELNRALQDAKDASNVDEYNKELAKIQPLLDANGKIVSDREGIVTSIFVENGGTTSDAIVSIADKNTGYKLVGKIEKSNRTSVKQGQTVIGKLSSAGIIENLTIESISVNKEDQNYLDITVVLPVGVGEIDDTGEIIISSKSNKFNTCVPLAALRQGDGDNYYILVVSDKETVLGTEMIAKKVEVKVEKKDSEFAAINSNAISKGEQVIIDSNKNVEDGDRVRLESE